MNRALQTWLRGERGSVLISGMLLTLALLMVLGAAVDIGHAFIVRRDLSSLGSGMAHRSDSRATAAGLCGLSYALSWGYWLPLVLTGQIARLGSSVTQFPGRLGPMIAALLITSVTRG